MTTVQLHPVDLRNLPVRLWHESRLWFDELLREFTVIDSAAGGGNVPWALIRFVEDVTARFLGFNDSSNLELEAAHVEGRSHIDLRLNLPDEAAQLAMELWNHIIRADEFCREGDLLIVHLSERVRTFLHWYLFEVKRQLEGGEPIPWSGSDS
jgi:hypothetical protein